MICSFFGHRDTPKTAELILHSTLIDLIENHGVNSFYVGNQGGFDFLVKKTLKKLQLDYPHINYYIVLAYMPIRQTDSNKDYSDTIYPDGLESTPPKYAIDKRNRWMIDKSDYVITYVSHTSGGAAKFKELAEKKGRTVINLADI